MQTDVNPPGQENALAAKLSKVFGLTLRDAGFQEKLLADPRTALQSSGLGFTPEETEELVRRLGAQDQMNMTQVMLALRNSFLSLIDLVADRIVAPTPPPPPPPICWPPDDVVAEGVRWTKVQVAKILKAKPKAKSMAKSKARPKVRAKARSAAAKRKARRR